MYKKGDTQAGNWSYNDLARMHGSDGSIGSFDVITPSDVVKCHYKREIQIYSRA